uniref:Uncharacterized protein n=1 Tax=Pristionchus pacificus TaxID=54126 RepID=A0A2A6BL36_PRIPA|eukprot:PDM66642.1 hypothetical protein PRIPAC_48059 [Pristionchus pacificus]
MIMYEDIIAIMEKEELRKEDHKMSSHCALPIVELRPIHGIFSKYDMKKDNTSRAKLMLAYCYTYKGSTKES